MPPKSDANGAGKKRPKKGRNVIEVTNVAESTRIRIAETLDHFRASDAEVYTFEENLTNQERAAVHMLCRKMGLKSKSSGRGQQRRISVYKIKKEVGSVKGRENLVSFRFSEEAKSVLQDLFSHYPPDDVEMAGNKIGESSGKNENARASNDEMFCKPTMNKSDIENKVASLASRTEEVPKLRQIAEGRSRLPIASFKDTITSTLDSHQVVLICGETGCGKTTQVPQFLLDHEWGKGEACKIICTQPRRISATSVAERIAAERGENIGDSVGYKIRLESKGGRHSSLVFCTNGVLLRVLVSKGSVKTKRKAKKKPSSISEITHIIVDEIHERDRYSDFMLAILRDMLPLHPHLHLVLMSATIDADRFSSYFGGCPIIQVPGFTYPVKSYYLEDVLSLVRSPGNNNPKTGTKANEVTPDSLSLAEEVRVALDEALDLVFSNDEIDPLLELISSEGNAEVFNYKHSETGLTPLMVFAAKGRVGDVCMLLSLGADCNLRSNEGKTAFDYAQCDNQMEIADIIKKHMEKTFSYSDEEQKLLDKYLSNVDPELIDCVLIEQLLRRICNDSKEGAILVFLPGWDDINRTRERLANAFYQDSSRFTVVSLHSMVPLAEQKKVFKRPPPGCRKIVLSTNIAETSVTIEDVVYVIDTGRMKEKSYDPYNNVSTLHSSWISKASAKQREGRAGRCQPGVCYHLFSRLRAASLPDFQVPEIKRMPIEELCLQVKLMDPSCKIEEFLQKTLDPPIYETIRNAIIVLQEIGALSSDEKLTDLGEKLGSLPVHPLTCKMLFLAILLNCLDPALTLACASDYRDPFILPMVASQKKKAQEAKSQLASFYGGNGDQLAVIAAFDCWKIAKERGEEAQFCSQYYVSSGTMKMLSGMRKQLESELMRNGFIPNNTSHCSLNAHDPGIIHAVVVAGLYPMVGRVIPNSKKRSLIETADGNKVRLHPLSSNSRLSFKRHATQPLIVFDEITRGDGGLHIRNCTVVSPLPLMLLATEIVVAPASENDEDDGSESEDADIDSEDENKTACSNTSDSHRGEKIMSSPENVVKVVVDRWLPFESTALDVAQIYCLRERLSAAILHKVTRPHIMLPKHLGASLHTIAWILTYDGMSGISLPLEPDDPFTSIAPSHGTNQNHPGNNQPTKSYLKSLSRRAGQHHQNPNPHFHRGNPPQYFVNNHQNSQHHNSNFALESANVIPTGTPTAPLLSKRTRGGNRHR